MAFRLVKEIDQVRFSVRITSIPSEQINVIENLFVVDTVCDSRAQLIATLDKLLDYLDESNVKDK